MRNIARNALICMMGLAAQVGTADARKVRPHQESLPSTQASRFFATEPVRAWNGQGFTIIRISQMNWFDALRAMIENQVSTYPDQIEGLQAAIRQNRALAAELRSRNVQIQHIVAIQQAFNGNLIFYLR